MNEDDAQEIFSALDEIKAAHNDVVEPLRFAQQKKTVSALNDAITRYNAAGKRIGMSLVAIRGGVAAITGTVTPTPVNVAPTVAITSPTQNQSFADGAPIVISAVVSDAALSKIEFFRGLIPIHTVSLPTSGTHSFTDTAIAQEAPHIYKVVATDIEGLTGQDARTVTVPPAVPTNTPPTVSLSSPTQNQSFLDGAQITINATVTDANLSKVEFFRDATLLKTVQPATSGTHSHVAIAQVGAYVYKVKATDAAGLSAEASASVMVTAPATGSVNISSAVYGATPFAESSVETIAPNEGWKIAYLNDQSTSTLGWAHGTPGTFPTYAGVLFPRNVPQSIQRIVIGNYTGGSAIRSAQVQYFAGNIWTTAQTFTDIPNTFGDLVVIPTAPISCTGVRVFITQTWATNGFAHVKEVEAWTAGTPASFDPTVDLVRPRKDEAFIRLSTIDISANVFGINVTSVEVYRNTELLTTLTASPYTYADTNVEAGDYTYRVKAFSGSLFGEATANVHVIAASTAIGNWDYIRTRPGVIMARALETDTLDDLNLSGRAGDVSGKWNLDGVVVQPSIDTVIKADGRRGALHFVIPTNTGGNAAGDFFSNFGYGTDVTACRKFGGNSDFWVRIRRRCNTAYATFPFQKDPASEGGGGPSACKFFDITGGDLGRTADKWTNSSGPGKLVMQTWEPARSILMYRYLNGETSNLTVGLGPSGDIDEQPGSEFGFCHYVGRQGLTNPVDIPPGCIGDIPNVWQTHNVHYQIFEGLPTGNYRCRITAYIQYDYGPEIKWLEFEGEFQLDNPGQWGKIWIFPYISYKWAAIAHPTAEVWYNELAISTQRHPPAAASPPLDWLPAPGTIKTVGLNTIADVNPCPQGGCSYSGSGQGGVTAYSGMAFLRDYGTLGGCGSLASGGHADYFGTEMYMYDVYERLHKRLTNPAAVGTLAWNDAHLNNDGEVDSVNYPGVPAASHTYRNTQPWPARFGGGLGGSLVNVALSAIGTGGGTTLRFGSFACQTTTGTYRKIAKASPPTTINSTAGVCPTWFDSTRGYLWKLDDLDNVMRRLKYSDIPSNAPVEVWESVMFSSTQFAAESLPFYCPTLDRLVMIRWLNGVPDDNPIAWQIWTLNPANPTDWLLNSFTGFTSTSLRRNSPIMWCDHPRMNCAVHYTEFGSRTLEYITPPATDGGEWTLTRETLGGDVPYNPESLGTIGRTFSRLLWAGESGGAPVFLYFAHTNVPAQAFRPLATA